jgi:hypothetical protein
MWKSILMCISLFGSVALALVYGARWIEPAALPPAAAVGLCLIGIVLIRSAPTEEAPIKAVVAKHRPSRSDHTPMPEPPPTPAPPVERTAVAGNKLTS